MASIVISGDTSGTVTLAAPAVAGTQAYTLPTAVPAANGYALTSTTGGTMSWAAPAGSTTQVIYNLSGSLAGSANFTWNNSIEDFRTGNYLTLGGTRGYCQLDSTASDVDDQRAGAIQWTFSGNTTNRKTLALIEAATEGATATDRGGKLVFFMKPNGGAAVERMRINNTGYLLIGYTTSNGSYNLQVNSQIFATSAVIATSDARYKKDVTPVANGLDLVNKLNPVSFNWKPHQVHNFDTDNVDVGFIAQEVQSALSDSPYLSNVVKSNQTELPDGTKEDFLGIADGKLIPILVKAIQELSAANQVLTARIAALEAK